MGVGRLGDLEHPMEDDGMPELPVARNASNGVRPVRSTDLDDLLTAVVDDPEAWLSSPSAQFGGRKPADLIGTNEETKVVQLLQAVDQGLF